MQAHPSLRRSSPPRMGIQPHTMNASYSFPPLPLPDTIPIAIHSLTPSLPAAERAASLCQSLYANCGFCKHSARGKGPVEGPGARRDQHGCAFYYLFIVRAKNVHEDTENIRRQVLGHRTEIASIKYATHSGFW